MFARRRFLSLVRCTVGALLLEGRARSDGSTLAVIVNPQNEIENLSIDHLRAIFLRQRKNWPDGRSIVPLNWEARHPLRVRFDQRVLGMGPDDVASYWIDQRIRGGDAPPRALNSALLIVGIVSNLPEAIGYVLLSDATPRGKLVRINGKLPGDNEYALAQRIDCELKIPQL